MFGTMRFFAAAQNDRRENMNKYSKQISIFASGAAAFFFASLAHAQTIVSAPTNIITSPGAIVNLFCGALNWMFWFLIVLAIAMALVAAYLYATSNGDPEKVGKASKTLLYVVIAIVVALIAAGLPFIVSSFIGGGLNDSVCASGR